MVHVRIYLSAKISAAKTGIFSWIDFSTWVNLVNLGVRLLSYFCELCELVQINKTMHLYKQYLFLLLLHK